MKQNNLLKRHLAKSDKRPKWFLLYLMVFVSLLNAQSVLGQDKTISGTVVDENNDPLPGLSIIIQGTQTGTNTDFDGVYRLQVPSEGETILEFNFLGYTDQVITVGTNQTVIDVAMVPDVDALEEVVVVGYGVQKKETVVGAIGTATQESIKRQGNVSNLTDALTGVIPGLSVLSISGLPGGDLETDSKIYTPSEILIRGKTTWNDASPLILVDGVERNMNDIDVSEVESVSVLKDASATAVFGVKGGNGVILITTRRGKTGKSQFSIEAEMSLETPADQITVAPVYESAQYRNYAIERTRRFSQGLWDELYYSDEERGYFKNNTYPYAYQSLDWQDELYRDFTQSYRVNATASGGTEKVKYFASASFNHVGDLMKSEDLGLGYIPEYSYDRFNVRTNFDFQITSSTKLSANYSVMYGVRSTPPSNTREGLFAGTSQYSGDIPILQYEDGMYGADDGRFKASNPYYRLNFLGVESQPRTQVNMDYNLIQDLNSITEGLKITGKLAYDNTFRTEGREINPPSTYQKSIDKQFYLNGGYYDYDAEAYMIPDSETGEIGEANMDDWGHVEEGSGGGTEGFGKQFNPISFEPEVFNNDAMQKYERNFYYEIALRYARTFDAHSFTGLAMFSRQQTERGSNWPSKREDWVGRITYNFDSRYFLEVNGAYNGSEKFGPGYRFDFFPSVGGSWILSNENFLSDVNWLSNLKLRYSYGIVGNDRVNTGSTWPYLTVWDTYGFGGSGATFYGYPSAYREYSRYNEGNPGNANLRWETSTKQNFGLEFAAFNNTLTFTADYWTERRDDMLLGASQRANTVPPLFGKPAPPANVGESKSHGGELEVTYRNSISDFNYWVSANWATARSEVIFKESPELMLPHQRPEGKPVDQTWSAMSTHYINSWDDLYTSTGSNSASSNGNLLPGDFSILDFNADGSYNGADDNVPYGYPTYPQNNYGISVGGDWKGIDFSIQFIGAYNTTRTINPSLFWSDNLYTPEYLLSRTWTPEFNNSNPIDPAFSLDAKTYTPRGHAGQEDASFVRLNQAQLGYTLPDHWLGKVNVKIYANGRNLAIWSDMPNDGVGFDNPGKNYPAKKQVNFGLTVRF